MISSRISAISFDESEFNKVKTDYLGGGTPVQCIILVLGCLEVPTILILMNQYQHSWYCLLAAQLLGILLNMEGGIAVEPDIVKLFKG